MFRKVDVSNFESCSTTKTKHMELQQNQIDTQEVKNKKEVQVAQGITTNKPSGAFVIASWVSLLAGVSAFFIGLWNSSMEQSETGYFFTVILFGLFAVISVQKAVRDKLEGIPVTDLYYGISWFCTIGSIVLLTIGLWKADMSSSEKGFYAMSFVLSTFSAIAVQKNTRDLKG